MSRCWLEGEWRAYLDRELPADEMESAGRHLGTCPACSALVRKLGDRAERVCALMAALDYVPEVRPVRTTRWRRPVVAAAMALAAALLIALALPKKHPVAMRPTVAQAGTQQPAVSPPAAEHRLPTRGRITKLPHKGKSRPEYYLALDDDPIESGVVVQVTLPDSGLLAEVIYDEYGRPRAVRPLN